MRRLMTFGLISVAALATACSDDESSGGNGGSGTNNGGSAGNGNGGSSGANNGGSAGATNGGSSGATNGGSGNNGGSGGGSNGGSGSDPDAGDGGGEPPCTSCVELRVPVTIANEGQTTLFQFTLPDGAPLDMSSAIVTYRMRALTLDNQLSGSPFAQDDTGYNFEQRFTNLDSGQGFTSTDVWVDIAHNFANLPAAPIIFTDIPDGGDASDGGGGTPVADPAVFDKARVIQFGVNVGSAGGFTAVPETVIVLLDSVTFDGIDRPDVTFDESAEGFAANGGQPGSQIIHHPAP